MQIRQIINEDKLAINMHLYSSIYIFCLSFYDEPFLCALKLYELSLIAEFWVIFVYLIVDLGMSNNFFINNVMTFCLIFLRSPKMALLYFIVQTFLTFCVKTLKVNQSLLILLSTWQSKFYGLIGMLICLLSSIKLKITPCL